jgi:formylglycine-generating enzyme required for sulfatase activity
MQRVGGGEKEEAFAYYQAGKAGRGKRRVMTLDLGGGVKMEFVRVPKGKFKMGSPEDEKGRDKDEELHDVEITHDFYLGKYHVTRGQFRAFVQDSGYETEAEKDGKGGWGWNPDKEAFEQNKDYNWKNVGFEQGEDHPVLCVSWNDAEAFSKWLSRKTGKAVRLPTEAEWEYACRAGSTTRFSSGDDPETLARVGNVADGTAKTKFKDWDTIEAEDGYVFTAPAGKFAANRFGLHDMHGNAWQWCADWYGPYGDLPRENPLRAESVNDKEGRVLRGGSWTNGPVFCRAAGRRGWLAPSSRDYRLGFRVAYSLD